MQLYEFIKSLMLMIGSKNKRQIAKERKAFLNGAFLKKIIKTPHDPASLLCCK